MKKITGLLLTAIFILYSSAVFADDNESSNAQTPPTSNPMAMPKNFPKAPKMPPFFPGMMGAQKTVVATADGGIVIVQGNRITKLNKNLEIVKTIELKDTVSNQNNY